MTRFIILQDYFQGKLIINVKDIVMVNRITDHYSNITLRSGKDVKVNHTMEQMCNLLEKMDRTKEPSKA